MLLHVVGSQSRRRHGRGAEGEARCQQQRQEGRFEPHCVNEVGDLRIAREQGGKVRTFSAGPDTTLPTLFKVPSHPRT